MTSPDKKISLLLTGGQDNRTFSEFVSPVITQGESPKLVRSTNTRFTVKPGTCVRAPKATTVLAINALAGKRWGLIPSQNGKTVALPAAGESPYFFSGSAAGTGLDTNGSTTFSTFCPARITGGASLDDVSSVVPVTIAYDATTGIMWRAYQRATDLGVAPCEPVVSAWSLGGVLLGVPRGLGSFVFPSILWSGLTAHGASGVRVWYSTPAGICVRSLSLVGRGIVLGAETVIALPGSNSGIDVVSDGGNYAYLAHGTVGSPSNGTLRRIDVTNHTTTHQVTLAGALAGTGHVCVQYGSMGGSIRVAVAFSRTTGVKTTVGLYDAALTTVGAPFEISVNGFVTMGHAQLSPIAASPSSSYLYVYNSPHLGDFDGAPQNHADTSNVIRTVGHVIPLSTWGTAYDTDRRAWTMLQSHAVHYTDGVQERPVMFFGRTYGNVKWLPGDANYVDDPCVTVVMINHSSFGTETPLARYGVIRGVATPVQAQQTTVLASRTAIVVGNKIYSTYKRMPTSTTIPYAGVPYASTCRMVTIDLASHQPPIAHDKDGVALVAAAMPIQVDGANGYEIGSPTHAPRIAFLYNSTFIMQAGSYSFAVVFRWTDAAGGLHRSRPSNLITRTFNGTNQGALIYAAVPDGAVAKAVGKVFAQLYMSEKNGATLHLHSESFTQSYGSVTSFLVTNYADGARPQIYSTGSLGEELGPQPPPPLRDITIVGSRAWGVDAEYPSRLVFSKLRIAGYGYEFNPALEVNLPSGSGECMAIRGAGGVVFALCEKGVWQIVGDGPNNNASGVDFSPPIKVSDIGCSNTASAVVCPAGIIWQNRDRFVMMSGAGVDYIPDLNCTYDVTHAIAVDRHNEIWFFSSAVAEVRVYNHAVKRWSVWDSQTLPEAATLAVALPWDPDRVLTWNATSATLRALDAGTVSTAASMTWETDWFLLGGDFQDHCIVRDVILNGAIVGPHSVTIEIFVDYETTASRTKTWDSAWLAANAIGGRYTVRLEPSQQNCRAMKLKVYDTVAPAEVVRDGMAPRSLTIVWALEGMLHENVFVEGSRA